MGRKMTQEQKDKISKAMKGRKKKPFTEEHKANLRKARAKQVMTKRTQETKDRMSKAQMGHVTSEATKAKISAAHMGKVLSEEHKAKMRGERPDFNHSEEARQSISDARHGSQNVQAKLNEEVVWRMRFGDLVNEPIDRLALNNNVTPVTIIRVLLGITWDRVTFDSRKNKEV